MTDRNSTPLAAFAAAIICLLVFLPALRCGFVGLDDMDFVVNNTHIRSLNTDFFTWAFTMPRDLWLPLTWFSFAIDYQIWGLNPFGFHLTNILLHAVNTGLVVLITARLLRSVGQANDTATSSITTFILLVSGLLYGVHPLRVESVVWVTERKDVLNGIFTFSSIICYLGFVRALEQENNRSKIIRMYGASYLLFCLSLMAKPASLALPLLFLLADYCPLGRFRKGYALAIILEKLPFLFTSAILAFLTLGSAASKNLFVPYEIFPLAERLVISFYALFEYVRLEIMPTGIAPFHAIPNPIPLSCNIQAFLTVVAIILCVCSFRKRRWLFVACPAFVLPLIPVLTIMQNGAQAFAARYTYLPALTVSILVAFLLRSGPRQLRNRIVLSCCGMAVLTCIIMTERLIPVWNNTESLWSRVIDVQPVGRAYKERGVNYLTNGKYEAALGDLDMALKLDSEAGMPYLHNYFALKGAACSQLGRFSEAVADYTEAISLFPCPNYYYHRGLALLAQGRNAEALADIVRAGNNTGPVTWLEDQP